MIYKDIAGIKIPAVGTGTWEMGGRDKPDYSKDTHWVNILQKAISLGMWHIDTAEYYGGGHAEELTGLAIRDFKRNEVFITSKVWSTNLKKPDMLRAAERSLNRLGTSFFDLYLIHFPNPSVPVEEAIEAMNDLAEQGITRLIGVSNFEKPQLEKAIRASSIPIAANQIEYGLLSRNQGIYTQNAENDIIPFCKEHNISIIAWRPLGKDNFGKLATNPLILSLSKKYQKTPAQIAINWVISHDNMITIPKTGSFEHLIDNAEAADFEMHKNDIDALQKTFLQ